MRISEQETHSSSLVIYCAKIRSSKVVRQIPETGAAEAVTSSAGADRSGRDRGSLRKSDVGKLIEQSSTFVSK